VGVKERREREEQARLEEIFRSAESVFARKGYHETHMDDIAETAELAKGTLYYYFKSKDEIFCRLLERESKKVFAAVKILLDENDSFYRTLEKVVNFYVEYFQANPGFLKMFLPCMCGFIHFEDPGVIRRSVKSYESHREFIREALQKKMSKENAAVDLDDLLKFIKTLQIGISLRLLEGSRKEAENAARFFLDLMKRILEKSS
jgi:AcrR family transcriptional regulator